jgi:hypothetical protein
MNLTNVGYSARTGKFLYRIVVGLLAHGKSPAKKAAFPRIRDLYDQPDVLRGRSTRTPLKA